MRSNWRKGANGPRRIRQRAKAEVPTASSLPLRGSNAEWTRYSCCCGSGGRTRIPDPAAPTVAVLSEAYLRSAHGGAEWRAAYAEDPSGEDQRLVPVRVEVCEPTGLLRIRVYVDLVGLDEPAARKRLMAAFDTLGERAKPVTPPEFPRVAFPGQG